MLEPKHHIELSVFSSLQLNITLGVVVRINNPNYGKFKLKSTTSFVNYHETMVAEFPSEHETVPACGTLNINTSAENVCRKADIKSLLLELWITIGMVAILLEWWLYY